MVGLERGHQARQAPATPVVPGAYTKESAVAKGIGETLDSVLRWRVPKLGVFVVLVGFVAAGCGGTDDAREDRPMDLAQSPLPQASVTMPTTLECPAKFPLRDAQYLPPYRTAEIRAADIRTVEIVEVLGCAYPSTTEPQEIRSTTEREVESQRQYIVGILTGKVTIPSLGGSRGQVNLLRVSIRGADTVLAVGYDERVRVVTGRFEGTTPS